MKNKTLNHFLSKANLSVLLLVVTFLTSSVHATIKFPPANWRLSGGADCTDQNGNYMQLGTYLNGPNLGDVAGFNLNGIILKSNSSEKDPSAGLTHLNSSVVVFPVNAKGFAKVTHQGGKGTFVFDLNYNGQTQTYRCQWGLW